MAAFSVRSSLNALRGCSRRPPCVTRLFFFVLVASSIQRSTSHDDVAAAIRSPMCRAVVHEMHTEIHKHKLRKDGEDDIYETVPAICMAIVQNYTLQRTPAPAQGWVLKKREGRLDDEDTPSPTDFEHLVTLKKACESFTEEFQQELSGLMYNEAYRQTPADIVDSFCNSEQVRAVPPTPRSKPKRRQASAPAKSKTRRSKTVDEPMGTPSMEDLMQKYDTDGSISNLIEMERENPEAILEPADLEQVQLGSSQVQCDVCHAMCKIGLQRVKKQKAWRDEDRLSDIVASLCVGTPPGSEADAKYPGNPPLWAELYSVTRPDGVWRMTRLPKGSTAEERAGRLDYNALTIKHAMISRACRQTLSDRDDPDLAEMIYKDPKATADGLQTVYCEPFCAAPIGSSPGAPKDEV